jgi:transcription elongation factor Elf1
MQDYIQIDGEIYQKVNNIRTWYSCPFCNSENLIKEPDDDTFCGRTGCLVCNKWINKVRTKL